MEESIDFKSEPHQYDNLSASELFFHEALSDGIKNDPSQYSPLVLAYLGDCVYELLIRSRIVSEANMQVNKLNKRGSQLAMAKTQAAMVEALTDQLTDEEKRFIQRGKNAKVVNIPKSCTAHEYHLATGFECLIGYLYLSGNHKRITELVSDGWKEISQE